MYNKVPCVWNKSKEHTTCANHKSKSLIFGLLFQWILRQWDHGMHSERRSRHCCAKCPLQVSLLRDSRPTHTIVRISFSQVIKPIVYVLVFRCYSLVSDCMFEACSWWISQERANPRKPNCHLQNSVRSLTCSLRVMCNTHRGMHSTEPKQIFVLCQNKTFKSVKLKWFITTKRKELQWDTKCIWHPFPFMRLSQYSLHWYMYKGQRSHIYKYHSFQFCPSVCAFFVAIVLGTIHWHCWWIQFDLLARVN